LYSIRENSFTAHYSHKLKEANMDGRIFFYPQLPHINLRLPLLLLSNFENGWKKLKNPYQDNFTSAFSAY